MSDNLLYEIFFEAMLKRVKEKEKEHGDSWKYCDKRILKEKLANKYKKWMEDLQEDHNQQTTLVDIANFCMFLYLRNKSEE